ncbi:hypothetical protein B0H16DRAFT_1861526 [Mycena metata]|uniref:Uncharacterized protein n=1 Tax=Mycena metata TaxID=1033252 RepID=A0AAD7IFT0_9AGAR|nr:hypothetical protein B0H16DRAFT_1861526 [Mycena metata]
MKKGMRGWGRRAIRRTRTRTLPGRSTRTESGRGTSGRSSVRRNEREPARRGVNEGRRPRSVRDRTTRLHTEGGTRSLRYMRRQRLFTAAAGLQASERAGAPGADACDSTLLVCDVDTAGSGTYAYQFHLYVFQQREPQLRLQYRVRVDHRLVNIILVGDLVLFRTGTAGIIRASANTRGVRARTRIRRYRGRWLDL